MLDAFGNNIYLGCRVLAIANANTFQTFYIGKVINFIGEFATLEVEKVSNSYSEEYVPRSGDEKRICASHKLVKI
jgi:hypothetical protein